MNRSDYRPLEKVLGYRFRRKTYLAAALTHRSFRFEDDHVEIDNQRLEFLGDAALGLVAAAYFYEAHPSMQEGEMTKLRSRITSRQALARIAKGIELGNRLRLGKGELNSGGRSRPSNMADALEAILGAAYLDGGLRAARKIFDRLFMPLLSTISAEEPWSDNPKGTLQELCQDRLKTSPRYHLAGEDGPAHARNFSVEVSVNGKVLGQGQGQSKRTAEMLAAQDALRQLHDVEGLPDKTPETRDDEQDYSI